jgi:hypothetical protein
MQQVIGERIQSPANYRRLKGRKKRHNLLHDHRCQASKPFGQWHSDDLEVLRIW